MHLISSFLSSFPEGKLLTKTVLILLIGFLVSKPATAQTSSYDKESVAQNSDIIQRADAIPTLRSLIIQQNDEVLVESYFNGRNPDRPFNIKSASKSLISLLTGIAIERGYISSADEKIGPYFEDYFEDNPDSARYNLTIRSLLSMQAGLETTSFHNYGKWVISDNWAEFQLDQPFREEPGGKMVYSTGISHLLSVIITKASGMSTRGFADRYLFEPLDISPGGWDRDPQGYYMGGNNLALTPRDLLKIGRMILNGGEYEGERIISKEWLAASFGKYTMSNYNPYHYGYMWWSKEIAGVESYFAWGYGGQYLFMIPETNALIVMTSSLAGATQRRSYKEPIFDLLENDIVPYLKEHFGTY